MCKRAVAPEPHPGPMPSQRSHPAAPLPVGDTGRTMSSAFAELAELEYRLGDWPAAHASALESLLRVPDGRPRSGDHGEFRQVGLHRGRPGPGGGTAAATRPRRSISAGRSTSNAIEAMAGEAVGFLELGLDRVDSAIDHLERVAELSARDPEACAPATTWATDLAEAYVRRGDLQSAKRSLARLYERQLRPSRRASSVRRRCSPATRPTSSLFQRALAWSKRAQEPFEARPHASSASASASIARAAWRRHAPASRRRATPSSPRARGRGPSGPGDCWPAGVTSARGRQPARDTLTAVP